jgi:hypothetical protein
MNEDVLFFETNAAAQSLKNLWTRMASTYKCMQIKLTERQLTIRPLVIIGWLCKLLGLDLYHTIPVNRIRAVEDNGKWLGYGKVRVQFERDGAENGILLYLKKHAEFRDILEQTIKHNRGE